MNTIKASATRRKLTALTAGLVACVAGGAMIAPAGASTSNGGLPEGSEPVTLDPSKFTTNITNPYWPMAVGSKWVYRETDDEGTVLRVVVRVTKRTKQITGGITARVVRDVVTENGKPVEVTDDWYAQDDKGNIWYMGEDTAEYRNGRIVNRGGSFEHGVDGAQAGIAMPANPQIGLSYRQEYYAGEAEDAGKVLSLDEQVEVTGGHFRNVLMTRDTNSLEPKVNEHKFYAKGVGPVLALGISGSSDREDLIRFKPGK
jgi:hypothetical protein